MLMAIIDQGYTGVRSGGAGDVERPFSGRSADCLWETRVDAAPSPPLISEPPLRRQSAIRPEGAMSRISTELQRLEAAIARLEGALESADKRRQDAWQQSGDKMDVTVERVDRAIHRLETVLQD